MELRPAKTIVVASSTLVREGIAKILNDANFPNVVAETTLNGIESKRSLIADRVLLVIEAGHSITAQLYHIGKIRRENPSVWIAIFGDQMRKQDVEIALREGANACFVKIVSCDSFIKSLELVILGEVVVHPPILAPAYNSSYNDDVVEYSCSISPDETVTPIAGEEPREKIAAHLDAEASEIALSTRQQMILECLINGDSNKVIARKMSISEATVKAHVKILLRKIHVHNRTQAAIWGLNQRPRFPLPDLDIENSRGQNGTVRAEDEDKFPFPSCAEAASI